MLGESETVSLAEVFDRDVETAEAEAAGNGALQQLRNDEAVRLQLMQEEVGPEPESVLTRINSAVSRVVRPAAGSDDLPSDVFARCEAASEAALMAGRNGHALHVLTMALAQVKGALPAAIAAADPDIRPTLEWLKERL